MKFWGAGSAREKFRVYSHPNNPLFFLNSFSQKLLGSTSWVPAREASGKACVCGTPAPSVNFFRRPLQPCAQDDVCQRMLPGVLIGVPHQDALSAFLAISCMRSISRRTASCTTGESCAHTGGPANEGFRRKLFCGLLRPRKMRIMVQTAVLCSSWCVSYLKRQQVATGFECLSANNGHDTMQWHMAASLRLLLPFRRSGSARPH